MCPPFNVDVDVNMYREINVWDDCGGGAYDAEGLADMLNGRKDSEISLWLPWMGDARVVWTTEGKWSVIKRERCDSCKQLIEPQY